MLVALALTSVAISSPVLDIFVTTLIKRKGTGNM